MLYRSTFLLFRANKKAFSQLNSLKTFQLQNIQRHFSTSRVASASSVPPAAGSYLPPPPSVPIPSLEATETLAQQLNALGEPTLSSLGLASWYPSGLIQWGLENIHVALDVPWWTSIVIGTIILRIATFPLVVLAQRNSAHMHNHMPEVQRLQEKFQKVKNTGNMMDVARHGSELYTYMNKHKVNPVKNAIVPMIQLPIFLSVFLGIRQMANMPVESMTSSGILWFTDLTSSDPFYALPFFTMVTLAVTIELGVDGMKAQAMSQNMRRGMRLIPLLMMPFTINFPSALLLYWFTSNVVSLAQVLVLRTPVIREHLGIPSMVQHPPRPKKPLFEGIKDTWKNSKAVVDVSEMQRQEAVRFKEAGIGAIQKTYSKDPTKKLKLKRE